MSVGKKAVAMVARLVNEMVSSMAVMLDLQLDDWMVELKAAVSVGKKGGVMVALWGI